MTCPRCGLADVAEPTCPRCGVVFAKLRDRPARPAPPLAAQPRPAPEAADYSGLILPALVLVGAVGGGIWAMKPRPPAAPPLAGAAAGVPAAPEPPPQFQPARVALPAAPPPVLQAAQAAVPQADQDAYQALAGRVAANFPLGSADVQKAEELYARYPQEEGLISLLAAVLVRAAEAAQSAGRGGEAAQMFRRAAQVVPASPEPHLGLMALALAAQDWPGAEAAAQAALQRASDRVEALEGLAYALFRQDRNREAAEVLRRSLGVRETASARALLARIEKGRSDERGMTEQRISHFHVRYDGGAHEDVGREILSALERHYATLASTFGHQPATAIPVILHSSQQYYSATGAPSWAGGTYDSIDGRIRIPIGGLNASLASGIDEILIHEVTHAFIADISRGAAPRDLHEGFAQYMEGKRIGSELSEEQGKALAEGRIQGVYGFYLQALSFVEFLIAQRGQGGINELLKAMGDSGDVDAAFRRVHGRGYRETHHAWIDRVRQQYGAE